ncbi:MAG: transcription elongation factor Spt5 [Candidatus Methanomethylicia archaeon]|nr:transcription elongation factor Spt5 [Candidatus Methanomethylicia archaeon]MDW7988925.1 transcription elongation factor Spt5 [Nitrososphaerota archaeon]
MLMSPYYAIRTTAGQEGNVALLIETRSKASNIGILSIIAPERVSGFIFIEVEDATKVDKAISGIRHVKGWLPGIIDVKDIERFLIPKSPLEELKVSDLVEVVSGPLRGMLGKVTKINLERNEVTIELLEVSYTLPITINADAVRKTTRT